MKARFLAITDGRNRLGLKELCQQFIDELRMPTCLTKDEAAQYMLDLFKRSVASELELLDVKGVEVKEQEPDAVQVAAGRDAREAAPKRSEY